MSTQPDHDTWPFCPIVEERALRRRNEACRQACTTPGCNCPDPALEAQYAEWREDAELCALDPREAAYNAWDGERQEPVV